MAPTGRIVADDVEQLRERADIVEIISGHLQLKKAGRVFKGLCCFHQEKTPSFTVDPGKQLYHCFGCGAGGDVFTFLRQVEGLNFTEAAERLAATVGIVLRYEQGSTGKAGSGRHSILEINAASTAFFAESLMKSPEATMARRYLESRGFTSEDASQWKIGFAPRAKDELYRHLLSKRFNSKQIVESDVVYVNEAGEHRDRFRGRLVFPISDLSGQPIGFGARALGDQQPKYINSRETPVYHKAKILFGLDRAKAEMTKTSLAIVTEGYTDVIALHKVGAKTAVATCGTALGEEHFALIKRFCDRVILAFDSDAAGATATERGFKLHEKFGLEVLVAVIPDGKDPADVALTEGGESVSLMLEQAQPLMRFVLEQVIARQRIDTAEGKGKAVRTAAEYLAWEPSAVARGEHAFWVARRVGVDPNQVQLEIADSQRSRQKGSPLPVAIRRPGHVKVEREALGILLDSPSHLRQAGEWLTEDHFTQPEHRVLLRVMLDSLAADQVGSVMSRLPDDETRRAAAELSLLPAVTEDAEEVFLRLEEFRVKRQIDTLRATLDRLDPEKDQAEYDGLFEELMSLEKQRRRFDE